MHNYSAEPDWTAFITKLEIAEEDFVQGDPRRFKLYGPMPMMLPFAVASAVSNVDGKTSRIG
jgi:hypothetical protein